MALLIPKMVFRLWEVDGVPDSGKHEPIKSEIVQLLDVLFGVTRGGWVVAKSRLELQGVVPDGQTQGGVVLNDPNPAYNGYYQPDAGVWVRERGFPDSLARLTVSGGTANAVVAIMAPGVNPADVEAFVIRPTATNTGNVTLNLLGTVKPVKNVNGAELAPGEWTSGRMILISDEGSEYRLLSDPDADGAAASASASATAAQGWAAAASATAIPAGSIDMAKLATVVTDLLQAFPVGYLQGLTLSNNATDAVNDIDIAVGKARDIADARNLVLGTALTKRLDAAWAVGNGNGGLDTGSKANTAWYHLHLIRRDSDGLLDVLFSGSLSNPAMPAGWTARRRLGAVLTDGAGAIIPFVQTRDYFGFKTPVAPFAAGAAFGPVLRNIATVPLGKKFRARLWLRWTTPTTGGYFGVKDPDEGAATVSDAWDYADAGAGTALVVEVLTNSSGQIYTYGQRSDATIANALMQGFYDDRERA